MKTPIEWLKELGGSNNYTYKCGEIIAEVCLTESDVARIQQDAYQAGLKDGEIKGLERAMEIASKYCDDGSFPPESEGPAIYDDLQSEIQKRKETNGQANRRTETN